MVQRRQNPARGSEYGGVDGLVAPLPHVPNERESLLMMYQMNPAAGFPLGLNPETEEEPPPSVKVAE